MISVAEADAIIAANLFEYPAELCPLLEAHGRILRENIVADRDQPPFDRVTMDGIAVSTSAVDGGKRRFRIQDTLPAGTPPLTLNAPEACIEVMTGAVLPPGADAVVRVEDIEVANGFAVLVAGLHVKRGQNIHHQGTDERQGDLLLAKGSRLGTPEIAVAASAGKASVLVARCPSVAIVSTGDELVDAHEPVLPHQVRRSNVYAIRAAFLNRAFQRVEMFHIVDDLDQLHARLGEILEAFEVLVISGGVSMGKFDFVPRALYDLGGWPWFHKVSQRPGKPLWFGAGMKGQPVFALPGNPVSSLVCAYRYVFPQLDRAMGMTETNAELAALARPVDFAPPLTYFLPVRLRSGPDGRLEADPRPTNTSGDFGALVHSDGFVELDAGTAHFPAGYAAPVYRWNG